ncbi:GNAT family N-acetyltransferase [Corynebacterium sp. zg-331]|uniref:GNAT family N-acetyltransferase n=1 Tax=unclassified Corynebacterium TaxID=2624378 RepID=UPI00128C0DF6|nr:MULTISPECIES: GNAT family protein [unclassified Corynebacterium]MBC3186318.1 GNAT family N-acetyltransferase [Corynebacterium sp. zg-331]MPV52806.1 GNAT family N-acetyltransferase [Corynebacterium sp. zg331]
MSVVLPDGATVLLRPLRLSDGPQWCRQRRANEAQLRPVEPTLRGDWAAHHTPWQWWRYHRHLRRSTRRGDTVALAIEVDGQFAGQLTLGGIQRGAASECWIGYWVHAGYTGRGVATAACALGTDYALGPLGLHRVTATYLPTNPASGTVLHRNGYREEGYLRANLHIDGAWRDHHLVAQVAGEHGGSCVSRLRRAGLIR